MLRMLSISIFRFRDFQVNCLFFLFASVSSESGDERILKELQPLKYSGNCSEFCSNVICEPIQECTEGILKVESYCKCCEVCVKPLDINDSCNEKKNYCKIGLKCVNGKCQFNLDSESCLRLQYLRRTRKKEDGNYIDNIWDPQCDEEGNYAVKQMKTSKTFCFDKNGARIFGSPDVSIGNPCPCSLHMKEKANKNFPYNLKPQEHCFSNGSFHRLQCVNNLCYCADESTGEVTSALVKLEFLDKLPCYKSDIHPEGYLTRCERILQTFKKLELELQKKNKVYVKVFLEPLVNCDPDGTFSAMQCHQHSDSCICTDTEGMQIGSFKPVKNDMRKMKCDCARDSSPYMALTCDALGNYKSVSCSRSGCVCVNEDREIITKIIERKTDKYCQDLINNLKIDISKDDVTTTNDNTNYEYYEYRK